MEVIQEQREENEFNIEKNLCSIKQCKFQKNIIKQKYDLDIKVIIYFSEKSAIIEYNGKKYDIKPQSRKITFRDGQKTKEIFIYSEEHLKEVLNRLEFKAFNIINDENSCDSLDSENNNSEIFDIFLNESITTIFKDKPNLDKIKEKFRQRDIKFKKTISDLSLNSSFYYLNNKTQF